MQKSNSMTIVSALLALVQWGAAQAPNTPAAVEPADGRIVRGRSADPFRSVNAGYLVAALQPEVDNVTKLISLKWEVFSLPLLEAHKFLTAFKTDAERYAEIVKRTEAEAAVLEELQMLRTRSGQRAKVEAITEYIYPTEFVPPRLPPEAAPRMVANPEYKPAGAPSAAKPNALQPWVIQPPSEGSPGNALPYPCPTAFETRNSGSTLEIEPTLGPDGVTIDVVVAPEVVRFIGNVPHTPDRSLMQPKFQTQKLSTSFTIKSGRTFLLGTQSPPHLSGVEGANTEKVVWLSFMTAEVVRVE
jgi:hypothetical protein